MTAGTISLVCACGHPRRLHDDELGCSSSSCGCCEFRQPAEQGGEPAPAAGVQREVLPPDHSGVLIAAGKRSESPKTRQLAEAAERTLGELQDRLVEERERALAWERVRELEEHLESARQLARQAGGRPRPTETCPECGKPCASRAGLGIHRSRAHGATS